MMASHAEQSCSRMAKRGDYAASRGAARGWNQYFARHEATPQQCQVSSAFMGNMIEMDEALETTMELESSSASFQMSANTKASRSMFRRKARSKNDGLSSMLSKKSKKSKRGFYGSASKSTPQLQQQQQQEQQPPPPPQPLSLKKKIGSMLSGIFETKVDEATSSNTCGTSNEHSNEDLKL